MVAHHSLKGRELKQRVNEAGEQVLLLNARLVLEVILDATAALWENCRRRGLQQV